MTFEEKEMCIGYFGFGTGYYVSEMKNEGKAGYCNSCPLSQKCWDAHRVVVSQKVPDLTANFDKMAKKYKGKELMEKWMEETEGIADPYTIIMMGNLKDGAHVRAFGKPKDRGEGTLPYPFSIKN